MARFSGETTWSINPFASLNEYLYNDQNGQPVIHPNPHLHRFIDMQSSSLSKPSPICETTRSNEGLTIWAIKSNVIKSQLIELYYPLHLNCSQSPAVVFIMVRNSFKPELVMGCCTCPDLPPITARCGRKNDRHHYQQVLTVDISHPCDVSIQP